MTIEQEINALTWHNAINKLKSILRKLLNQKPYKVYRALISQTGTNAPTAIVLEDDIGGITFEYNEVGGYFIKSNGKFTENKTAVSIQGNYSTTVFDFGIDDTSTINFSVYYVINSDYVDGVIAQALLEIIIYN